MFKTIKQLADEFGVSKTAIRNYMDEDFRAKYTEKDSKGVITVTPDGCKLLSENFSKQAESSAKNVAETDFVTIPRSVLAMMERQIEQLQAELAKEREHSRAQADMVSQLADQAQRLHSGSLQIGAPRKRSLFGWRKKEVE